MTHRMASISLACLLAVPALAQEEEAPAPKPSLEERVAQLEEQLRAANVAPESSGALTATLSKIVSTVAENVHVTGVVSALYQWNLTDPPGRKNQNLLRVNDTDHNTFWVSFAKLGLYRDVSGKNDFDAGFRAEVGAGRMVEGVFSIDPEFNGGSEINLIQGYVDLQAPGFNDHPILIRGGRFYGWFGIESLDIYTNPNVSLSYYNNYTPYTHTGVSVGTDLGGGFRYTQYVVNGWDLVVDNNDSKSYGGQLGYTNEELGLWIGANWLVGHEQPGDEENLRWLTELDVIWKLFEGRTELRALLHYGQEESGGVNGGIAKYGGGALVVRQVLYRTEGGVDRIAAAGRLAYFRDQGGSKSGKDQALTDTTLTFEVGFTTWAKMRFEWRRDWSSESNFFLSHSGNATRRNQDTLAVELAVGF